MGMLRRYELQGCAEQPFETLSGGQQARFQILLLELSGATLLLLDEPTDNLDLVSAEALEAGLAEFTGTVVAVTHDRWFLRGFDRFVVFDDDCSVTDHLAAPRGVERLTVPDPFRDAPVRSEPGGGSERTGGGQAAGGAWMWVPSGRVIRQRPAVGVMV